MMNRVRSTVKLVLMLGLVSVLIIGCGRSGGLALRAGDDGRELALRQGETLTVSLPGNPSTGYTWEAVGLDEGILRQGGEPEFTPESDALGAPGVQVFRFRVIGQGHTVLNLVYQRPWEEAEPEQTFSVDVTVR